MTNATEPAALPEQKPKSTRRRRQRGACLPKWLLNPAEAQSIAHGRCLMVLSVLSGQKSVSEAIAEQKIARALYYQLEDRALKGMVQALSPAKSAWASERRELCRAQARIREQSGRLALLTQRKRSLERLLAMVMKTSRVSLDTRRRGRPPKALSRGMMRGADSP